MEEKSGFWDILFKKKKIFFIQAEKKIYSQQDL